MGGSGNAGMSSEIVFPSLSPLFLHQQMLFFRSSQKPLAAARALPLLTFGERHPDVHRRFCGRCRQRGAGRLV
jgi:hypothetical protein